MFKKRFAVIIMVISVLIVTVGCGANKTGKYVDGTYAGTGEGKGGPIKVEVVVEKGKIKEIKTLEHKETPGLSDPVFESITKAIIEKQTSEVDVVTGGTATSKGIIAAVQDAIKDASK